MMKVREMLLQPLRSFKEPKQTHLQMTNSMSSHSHHLLRLEEIRLSGSNSKDLLQTSVNKMGSQVPIDQCKTETKCQYQAAEGVELRMWFNPGHQFKILIGMQHCSEGVATQHQEVLVGEMVWLEVSRTKIKRTDQEPLGLLELGLGALELPQAMEFQITTIRVVPQELVRIQHNRTIRSIQALPIQTIINNIENYYYLFS